MVTRAISSHSSRLDGLGSLSCSSVPETNLDMTHREKRKPKKKDKKDRVGSGVY